MNYRINEIKFISASFFHLLSSIVSIWLSPCILAFNLQYTYFPIIMSATEKRTHNYRHTHHK